MSHFRVLTLVAGLLITVAIPSLMFAADPEPFTEGIAFADGGVYIGCTLGENWSEFPVHLMADFTSTDPREKLDVMLPLYVSWILYSDSTSTSQAVDPPQPITNYAWFTGFHNEFKVEAAMVEPEGWWLYNDCGQPWKGFEAPRVGDYPLNSNGQLHLEDVHGGIGTTTTIILVRYTNEEHTEGVELYLSLNLTES